MKFSDVRRSLTLKGFEMREGAKHEKYYFLDDEDRKTRANTVLSRSNRGRDVNDRLQSSIAKQMKLTKNQFKQFVDCTLSKEDYVRELERNINK